MNRREFLKASAGTGMYLCASSAMSQTHKATNLVVISKFKAAKKFQPIILPVSIGGKTYKFMVATGFASTVFDQSLENLLGKPKEEISTLDDNGDEKIIKIYYAPNATVGKMNLSKGGCVRTADLSGLRDLTGINIRGVLGMAFLRKYVMQVNYDTGEVTFMKPDYQEHKEWGIISKMLKPPRGTRGIPIIAGRLYNKISVPFEIDTSIPLTGVVSSTVFKTLVNEKDVKKHVRQTFINAKGNKSTDTYGRFEDLEISKQKHKGLVLKQGNFMGNGGALGIGFLSRHIVTFDFPGLKLYLKKGKAFDTTDKIDMSGMKLLYAENPNPVKKGRVMLVSEVEVGNPVSSDEPKNKNPQGESPAEGAGIKPGDYLFKLNGVKLSKKSLSQVRDFLKSKPDTKVKVVFVRRVKKADGSIVDQGLQNTLTLKEVL